MSVRRALEGGGVGMFGGGGGRREEVSVLVLLASSERAVEGLGWVGFGCYEESTADRKV